MNLENLSFSFKEVYTYPKPTTPASDSELKEKTTESIEKIDDGKFKLFHAVKCNRFVSCLKFSWYDNIHRKHRED